MIVKDRITVEVGREYEGDTCAPNCQAYDFEHDYCAAFGVGLDRQAGRDDKRCAACLNTPGETK